MSDEKFLPCGRPVNKDTNIKSSRADIFETQIRFKDYLAQENLKYTEQRWQMAEVILQTPGHLDSQSIVAAVQKKYPQVGSATVYRNIKVLVDAQILSESHVNEGKSYYERASGEHHDHMICTNCDHVFEFHDESIEKLQLQMAQNLNFKVKNHRHVIYVECGYKRKES